MFKQLGPLFRGYSLGGFRHCIICSIAPLAINAAQLVGYVGIAAVESSTVADRALYWRMVCKGKDALLGA